MKAVVIFILAMLLNVKVIGQSYEFSIHLTSGFFSFGGSDAVSSTVLFFSTATERYTANPYGRNSGFSYGFVFQAQRLTKSNYIIGLQTSYESLSSKAKIDSTKGFINSNVRDGKTIFTNEFLNLHPFIGKRFELIKEVKTDFTLGLDIGIFLKSKEHATGTYSQGIKFDISDERKSPSAYGLSEYYKNLFIDLRPRFEFINYYKKIGLTIGYSYGFTTYADYGFTHHKNVFSRMIRIGLVYKI